MLMNSSFISGLLDIPSGQSLEDAPIHLDQLARHIRIFIDLVQASGTAPFAIQLDDCKPLLDLCDRMQAPSIDKIVWQALSDQIGRTTRFNSLSPWEIFRLSATRDDHHVCGKAVTAFAVIGYQFDDLCSQPAEFYDGIPTLLTGNYRWKIKYGGQSTFTQVSWDEVATRFVFLKRGGLRLAAGTG